MKHIANKLSKYLLLGSIFVTLSCEVQENYIENNKRNILIEDFSLRNIQGKTSSKLLETANKIKSLNATAASSKTVYNADFDFYMEDEHGKHVVVDGKDSYTFEITRPTGDQKVENIVFNEKTDGSFDTYIIKYDFTKGEFSSLPTSVLKDKSTAYSELDSQTNRFNVICVVTETWVPGDYQYHVELTGGGGSTPGHWATSGMDCSGGSSNDAPAYSGGNPNGGNGNPGGAPTNNGGTISSVPVVLASPCKKVKKQLEKFAALTPALVTLKGMTGQSNENGIFIDNTATATTPAPVQTIPPNLNTGGTINLNMNPANQYTVIAHTHDASGSDGLGTFSIFSFGDLWCIADLIRTNHIDTDNFVFYVATADNTQYAMTIEWPSAFAAYFDLSKDPNNPSNTNYYDTQKRVELQKMDYKYYDKNNGLIKKNSNPVNDKANFLKLMAEMGNLATVFQVNSDFTTYSKLSLNSSGVAVPTPCTN